jgi:hypothetical protein
MPRLFPAPDCFALVAARSRQLIDASCHSISLSGCLHHEDAEPFGRLVRPLLVKQNPGLVTAV